MADLPATSNPNYGFVVAHKPRILEAQFGDGYSQRSADGLNADPIETDLIWQNIPAAEADVLDAFLTARGGHESFTYTLPNESTARVFVAPEWSRADDVPGLASLSVKLREVFV